MEKFRIASMTLIIGISFTSLCVASNDEANNSANAAFTNFLLTSALGTQTLEEQPETLNREQPMKSPNRAFLSSLIVPGSGQLYINAKRGYIQIAAEVGLLAAIFVTNNNAQNTRDDYRDVVRENVIFEGPSKFEEWDEVEDFEHATLFDNWHNVYTEDNGQPLDRTGKWYWEDRAAFKDEDREGKDDSPGRLNALRLREDANDKFELARTFLGLVILNHVVSAVEARIATKNYNKKSASQATFPKPFELDMQTTVLSHAVESQIVFRKRF